MQIKRNFSPMDMTIDVFQKNIVNALNKFDFLKNIECEIEDSLPWVNIEATRVIKPKDALLIIEELENNIPDEVLFHSLKGNELRLVFNARFQLAGLNIDFDDENDYSEEYAYDFGQTKNEFKEEYCLT